MSVKDGWVLASDGTRVARVEDVLHHLIDLGDVEAVAIRCRIPEDDVRAALNYASACVRHIGD